MSWRNNTIMEEDDSVIQAATSASSHLQPVVNQIVIHELDNNLISVRTPSKRQVIIILFL